MNDETSAFLIVGALLSVASFSGGLAAGRMSAPSPPAEVRYVPIPMPAALALPVVPEVPSVEPAASPVEPPPLSVPVPPVEAKPLPAPRPKVEAPPKAKQAPPPRPRPAPAKKSLSCAVIEREYQRMSWAEKMAAYQKATKEEIAQGKRCLGF